MIPLWSSTKLTNYTHQLYLAHMEWCNVWETNIGRDVSSEADRRQLLGGVPIYGKPLHQLALTGVGT